MNLENNFFNLLGLIQQFDIDKKAMKKNARDLLRQYHPDRFVHATAQEQRLAVQFTAHINTAVDTLKNPVSRALHLMLLHGVSIDNQQLTVKDPVFLMSQMDLREQLDEARINNDQNALQSLCDIVKKQYGEAQQVFNRNFDRQLWVDTVAKMQFFEKLETEIDHLLK